MDLGTYIEFDGRPAVRFERTYPHPVERVWSAVTEPGELAHWFPSAVEFDPREGGTIHFSGDPYAADTSGVVLAFERPHRFAFTWLKDEVHLLLEAAGEGDCRLTLINVLDDRSTAARNAAGWTVCLVELTKVVDGHPGGGPHSHDAESWDPVYEAHVRAGLPSGAEIPDGAPH